MNPFLLPDDYWYDDLVDLAVHEVVHLRINDHNEQFAAATDELRKQYRRKVYEDERAEKAARKEMIPH